MHLSPQDEGLTAESSVFRPVVEMLNSLRNRALRPEGSWILSQAADGLFKESAEQRIKVGVFVGRVCGFDLMWCGLNFSSGYKITSRILHMLRITEHLSETGMWSKMFLVLCS